MKISDLKATFYEASGTTSELSRKLAFAGIAVIWILRVGDNSGNIPFAAHLAVPLYCFVISLALDILQYIYKAVIYWALNTYFWRKHQNDEVDVSVSGYFNLPTHLFFWGKTVLVTYGYIQLLFYLQDKL